MAASDARTFAGLLAAQDDASLVALLTARRVPLTVGWTDFFDVADALLDPASLVRGLAALPRADAEALQRALDAGEPVEPAEIRARLLIAGLVDADGRPYDAVLLARALVADTASPEPDTAAAEDAARAAERAFAASTSLADVLQCALTEPLGRIGSGALGATDRRRLTEAGAVDDADGADELIAIAESAGLVVDVDRRWLVTSAGAAWLSMGTVTRWRTVAERLRDALPAAVRTPTGGWIPVSDWPGAHPLDPAWPATATRTRALLTRWAVLGPDGTTADWAEGLAQGTDADEAALQALLPPEVDRVFLQNDLTAIAPGPLEPRLDMRLRTMARRESRAQASTYRFTAETLSSALTAGETADSVREFLTEVSLTGVPQPLAYEIERSARRHGTVRVGTDWSGRTRVRTDDAALLQAIAVDQALRPLALVADGEDLVTRSGPDTTYWMLADARYPVTAVDADGIGRALDRHRIAPEPEPEVDTPGRYAPLVARLRAAHDADADSAWLERELDQAVRGHAVLIIVVRLPDGSEREITMEATGLGGGRLRGRDRGADVERTLPVSSIVSVRAA